MLSGFLEPGLAMNVGSGGTGSSWRCGGVAINVDVAIPPVAVPGFVCADVHAIPFATASFDGALAKDVLEHVSDVHAVLSEIRRTLKRGSRLVATVPRAIPRAVWDDPTHRRGFTKRALVTLLGRHDFEVELVRRIGAIPGAGRLGVEHHLVTLLRVPGIGHYLGTNWLAVARAR